MKDIVGLLHEGSFSCVVRNGDIHTFTQRGIADLFDMLTQCPDVLNGAEVADKIVGKGAAALMMLGGVKRIYADVLSEPALRMLESGSLRVAYGRLVPFIENRAKNDWCPVEKLCRNAETPDECLPLIRDFLERMRRTG